jgi:hypothetical protein
MEAARILNVGDALAFRADKLAFSSASHGGLTLSS